MKVNKDVKEKLIKSLKDWLDWFYKSIEFKIEEIKEAETVEKIMQLKKELLVFCLEGLPLEDIHCYFCILQDYKNDSTCKGCLYAKIHGYCADVKSDYKKVKMAIGKAIDTIEEKYYFGETYDEK